jgi:hypothetical protein
MMLHVSPYFWGWASSLNASARRRTRRCMLTSVWLTDAVDHRHRSSGLNTLSTRYEPSVAAAVPDAAAVSEARVADAKGSLSEV